MAKSTKNRDKQNANLVQNRPDYPREKIVENARRAAAISHENNRRRKNLREAAGIILSAAVKNETVIKGSKQILSDELIKEGFTWAEAVIAATVLQAVKGNISAVRELREIMGNEVTENADVPVIVFEERGGTDES